MNTSTSRHPKPFWCKHPSRSSMTDSNEYEWDTLLGGSSIVDMDVDMIHTYSDQPNIVDESYIGSNDFNPHIALMDHIGPSMTNLDLDTFGAYPIESTSLVIRDDIPHINHLEPVVSLSLMHSDLIDWSTQDQRPILPSFQNDYEIAYYLNVIEPVNSSTNELATNMTESYIKYLSHKIKRKKQWSDGDNHIVVVSEPQNSNN